MNQWPSHIELLTPQLVAFYKNADYERVGELTWAAHRKGRMSYDTAMDITVGLFNEKHFAEQALDTPIFAVDHMQVHEALWSAIDEKVPFPPMPPLPFPKIVIETMTDFTWRFHMQDAKTGEMKDPVYVDAFFIEELERGQLWNVMALTRYGGDPNEPELGPTRRSSALFFLRAGGTWTRQAISGKFEHHSNEKILSTDDAGEVPITRLPVEAVHYITAREAERIPLPRATRRRYERQHKRQHPAAWSIRIGERTYSEKHYRTNTGRHVTCRFLVQGHWMRCIPGRHYQQKPTYIESKGGDCIWRETYVKGPANAPWRAPRHPVRIVA